jgi:bacterioferritin-associated ferredoxin
MQSPSVLLPHVLDREGARAAALVDDGPGLLVGAVVGHDELEIAEGLALVAQEGVGEGVRLVENGQDDAHPRHGGDYIGGPGRRGARLDLDPGRGTLPVQMASQPGDGLVCRCYAVSGDRIRQAIREHGLREVEEVTAATRAGGGCGSCWDEIRRILDEVHGRPPSRDAVDASGLSAAQKRQRVLRLLEDGVLALLERNGLQMQVMDVTGDRVLARFTGDAAGGRSASYLALKRWLVQRLSETCASPMQLVELDVLERLRTQAPPP